MNAINMEHHFLAAFSGDSSSRRMLQFSGPELICVGLYDRRPVPIFVSVGEVSQTQSSRKDAHLVGLHGNIPAFIRITDGKVHDANMPDEIMVFGTSRLGPRLEKSPYLLLKTRRVTVTKTEFIVLQKAA
jgi:hypothetical protein